jgi:hypothetical protein
VSQLLAVRKYCGRIILFRPTVRVLPLPDACKGYSELRAVRLVGPTLRACTYACCGLRIMQISDQLKIVSSLGLDRGGRGAAVCGGDVLGLLWCGGLCECTV